MPRGITKSGKKRINRANARRRNRPILQPDVIYSIDEYAAFTDQSTARARVDVQTGRVSSVRNGKRIEILGAWIVERNRRRVELLSTVPQ